MKFSISIEENEITLKDAVELFALGICEDIADKEVRTKEVTAKCKILDSLSNALTAINA